MTAGRTVNSSSHHWGTPPIYVDAVRRAFGKDILLDPCSNEHSVIKAVNEYRLPEVDGLSATWDFETIYVNPPYGADRSRGTTIKDWLKRCYEANSHHGSEVISLIPVATNTSHWKRFIWGKASAVAFLYDTRLKFLVNGKSGGKGAPMSCAMVYWGPNTSRFIDVFSAYGAAVDLKNSRFAAYERKSKKPQMSLFEVAA